MFIVRCFFFLFMYSYSSYWNVTSVLPENQIPFILLKIPQQCSSFIIKKKQDFATKAILMF